MGNTRGFLGGYPYSRHSLSVAPIAGRGNGMQRDYWYTAARDPATLASPEAIGRYAAERTLSRLSARRIRTGKFPVLPSTAGRSTARPASWWTRWASRSSPSTST
ncbi:hypothetical protein G6F35_015805 [Rhizopus arrhizus]|nr:hypothetical protein G6F35_015805 [Rhizopus arrhizus]